jgi:hypothetical protein
VADPSIGPFVTQLVTKIAALPAVTGQVPPVTVYDGAPPEQAPDQFISVGGTVSPLAEGEQSFAQLGAIAMWEEYLVDVVISCYVGGDSVVTTAGANAQATSRTQAMALYAAIFEALRGDANFSIANGGTPLVEWLRIGNFSLEQVASGQGRMANVSFHIQVKNRISAF